MLAMLKEIGREISLLYSMPHFNLIFIINEESINAKT